MASRKRHESFADEDAPPKRKAQKKTRFVSPSEDPANFAEEVDSALEKPAALTRKGRVKTEGYESDSSDDGEGVVLSRRAGTKGEEDGEDDDMFASAEKEAKEDEPSGKKAEKFLRLGDIEGQEFNDGRSDNDNDGTRSRSSGSSSLRSSPEPEDEDDAARREKAGMGFELSAFNMREEMEEGKFAEDGTFVRSFDPHAMHDRWIDGADTGERALRRARRAKRKAERRERERLRAEEREMEQEGGKAGMEKEVLWYLKRGETVLEALARFGEKVKRAKEKEKREKKTPSRPHHSLNSMDVDPFTPVSPALASKPTPHPAKLAIERLTTLASNLLALGDVEVYGKTYEHFLRSVRSAGNVEPDWSPEPRKYEYAWAVGGTEGQRKDEGQAQVFGPFTEDEMKVWYDAQYFGLAGEKVRVRAVGGEWGDWDDIVE